MEYIIYTFDDYYQSNEYWHVISILQIPLSNNYANIIKFKRNIL